MPSQSQSSQSPPQSPFRAPTCVKCAEPMTLTAIEPHDKFPNLDLHTYDCRCGWTMEASVARI
jgi:hypothetical protein